MRLNLFAKPDTMRPFLFVYVSFLSLTSVTAQYAADTQALIIREIEHLYFDADPAGILSAVTPCSNYYDPSTGGSDSTVGRNTAAEWIRTAFRKLSCSHQSCNSANPTTIFESCSLPRAIFAHYVDTQHGPLRFLKKDEKTIACVLFIQIMGSKTLQMTS